MNFAKYRLSEAEVLEILARTGAVLTNDHFVYTSGKHGDKYINKDALYPDIDATNRLCDAIAYEFSDQRIQVVVGPEVGGVILQWATALHLREFKEHARFRRDVVGVYAEKAEPPDGLLPEELFNPDGTKKKFFAFNRGFADLVRGKRVLIVDDILTTGGSVEGVVRAVRKTGGEVVGVGVLANRGGVTAEAVGGVPMLLALADVTMDSWTEADCPLCKEGRPINTTIGKGREFLARKAAAAAVTV